MSLVRKVSFTVGAVFAIAIISLIVAASVGSVKITKEVLTAGQVGVAKNNAASVDA